MSLDDFALRACSQEELVNYLTLITEARGEAPAGYRYNGYEAYVLDRGKVYTRLSLTELERMEAGNCFANCWSVATLRADLFTYCEGWASSVIPIHHAWLIDRAGNVVDPTWGHRQSLKMTYYGVTFTANEISAEAVRILKAGDPGFSMLSPPTGSHPLLKEER
jgi:hypothetical protein